jgi:SAM-dependent methyltransferase
VIRKIKIVKRMIDRLTGENAGQARTGYDDSRATASHSVLSYSNVNDCLRWGLKPPNHSPWNWASNWVLHMARPTAGDRLLDLGCIDNPYVLEHCEKENIDATFVDIDPKGFSVNLPKNITFIQSDLTCALPFEDESFDVILSESSLEHLPFNGRLYAFQEAIRCLRPGGRMALSIGLPLGFGNDPETISAFETEEFFSQRHCCVYFPIDIRKIIDQYIKSYTTGTLLYPYNHSAFPGFDGYNEEQILRDPNILFDRYADHGDVPDVAKLRSVSVVEIGLFFYKSNSDHSTGVHPDLRDTRRGDGEELDD